MSDFLERFLPSALEDESIRAFLLDPTRDFPPEVHRMIILHSAGIPEADDAVQARYANDPEWSPMFVNRGELERARDSTVSDLSDAEFEGFIVKLTRLHQEVWDGLRSSTQSELEAIVDQTEPFLQLIRHPLAAGNDDLVWIGMTRGRAEALAGKLAEGFETCGNALFLARRLGDTRRTIVGALHGIGEIHLYQGQAADALPLYEESLEIARSLFKSQSTAESRRDLSISLDKVGDVMMKLARFTDALPLYEESLEICRSLVKSQNTVQSPRDLSVSLNKVGDVMMKLARFADALPLYEESLELRRSLVKSQNTVQSLRDLSVSLNSVGNAMMKLARFADALSLFEESLEMRSLLVKSQNSTVQSRRDLSVSLNKVADAHLVLGNFAIARDHYLQAREIGLELIAAHGDLQQYRRLVVNADEQLAKIDPPTP